MRTAAPIPLILPAHAFCRACTAVATAIVEVGRCLDTPDDLRAKRQALREAAWTLGRARVRPADPDLTDQQEYPLRRSTAVLTAVSQRIDAPA